LRADISQGVCIVIAAFALNVSKALKILRNRHKARR
jgi:hypothetical protein